MRTFLPHVSLCFSLWSLLSGCGSESTANYRTPTFANSAEAVAEKANPVVVNFNLPDRSANPDLAKLTGFYFRLAGEGADCPAGELIEEVGTWDDANREVQFKVNGKCSYSVIIRLGLYQAPAALALAGSINWPDHIKPIIDANCVSCHEAYSSYESVVANGDMIIREVEAGSMPQNGALGAADVAKLLAWKDGGYARDTAVVLPSEKEKQLPSVYYQNNNNDYLMAYEMLSRSTYELRRSLWIQPGGVEAGMVPKDVATWNVTVSP